MLARLDPVSYTHLVSVPHAVSAEVRLYEHLFTSPTPGNTPEGVEFTDLLNPDSMRDVYKRQAPFCVVPEEGRRCPRPGNARLRQLGI